MTIPRARFAPLLLSLVLIACGGGGGGGGDPGGGDPPGKTTVSYQQDILVIFQTECLQCHGGAGGLLLDTYQGLIDGGDSGAVVIPGDPAGSLVVKRLEGSITPRMPVDAPPLSGNEIDTIKQWILEGALDN